MKGTATINGKPADVYIIESGALDRFMSDRGTEIKEQKERQRELREKIAKEFVTLELLKLAIELEESCKKETAAREAYWNAYCFKNYGEIK